MPAKRFITKNAHLLKKKKRIMRKHSCESALFLHREVSSCLINALSGHALTGIKMDFCQVLTPCTSFALVGAEDWHDRVGC